MSTMLSCQDLSSREQRYDFAASTSPDVSTTTLVSLWDAGALDNDARQHETPRRESELVLGHQPTWSGQLSPQLQRNKLLQDTLMQREEELARLQEENNKLKEFLNSSYVKSLEEKAKKLLSDKIPDGPRHHKRRYGDFHNLLLHRGEAKKTCRNLSLEFCSAEELVATPPLDSWILETLGLQDETTVSPESDAITPVTNLNFSVSFPPSTEDPYRLANAGNAASFSPEAESYCDYSSIISSSSICSLDTSSGYSTSQSLSSEFSALGPSALYTQMSTGSSVSTSHHFTPPRAASTPFRSQDVSPDSFCSTSVCKLSPPGGDAKHFLTQCVSRNSTDLAFSMSLSPQNSVKTHTFPQGQAFTRRDSQGRWNFTWVPKQCS